MQEQYGEHYAQKVEDRLLQYLQKLETVLPGDAYIDKVKPAQYKITSSTRNNTLGECGPPPSSSFPQILSPTPIVWRQ